MDFAELVRMVCKRPWMYSEPPFFPSVLAYLSGYDHALDGTPLDGLREWLVARANGLENLDWRTLARMILLPEAMQDADLGKDQEIARLQGLADLLKEYLRYRAENGVSRVYQDYAEWQDRKRARSRELPNADRAEVDPRKLVEYHLSTEHPVGTLKANVIRMALGMTVADADEVRQLLLRAATDGMTFFERSDEFGERYCSDFLVTTSWGRAMIRSAWVVRTAEDFPQLTTCFVFSIFRGQAPMPAQIEVLDTVALTVDVPALGLTAGEVGAVVEVLGDGEAFEVEFCDNSGMTYGLHTLRSSQLIALHTRGQALRLRVEAA